ncbi:MAG: metallophosphoesterase [Fimbriimonadaceae bacterium]|nr:metallophosphoesterase [Fimbriimonadaceae bacterium]
MRSRDLLAILGTAVGTAMLTYGCLAESKRLVLERRTLRLKGWPADRDGFRIALIADTHIGHAYSHVQACRAVALALSEEPDFVVLAGDIVSRGFPDGPRYVADALGPLRTMPGRVVAIEGNHEFKAEDIAPVYRDLGFPYLVNRAARLAGVTWAGIGSGKIGRGRPQDTMAQARALGDPIVALWHEPDMVDELPPGARLMLSGHSHGGQFRFPGGFAPMHTRLGAKYVEGFYPDAPTPLYVSRGVGTTGPPSRFNCPPEVSLLTLVP